MTKKYWIVLPIYIVIFLFALLFENASANRLAILVVLGMAFLSIEVFKILGHKVSVLFVIVQILLVFGLEYESRFAINYLFHIMYFPIIISIASLEKRWTKGVIITLILIASSYKFVYLIYLEANYQNYSQSFFMLLVSILLIIVALLYKVLTEQKEEMEVLHQQLSDKHDQLTDYANEVDRFSSLRERTTLARDLHDSVGHSLTGLIMSLEMTSIAYSNSSEEGHEKLDQCKVMARDALKNLRKAVDSLRQDTYSYDALTGMIHRFAHQASIIVDSDITREYDHLTSKQKSTLYHMIQESLTNSVRHGEARRVNISVYIDSDVIQFAISDNGSGISEKKFVKGNGLLGLTDRVEECAGHVSFTFDNGFHTKGSMRR